MKDGNVITLPESAEDLARNYRNSFCTWHSDMWRSDYRDTIYYPPVADSPGELQEKLDRALVRALPRLREQVREAEAAAERLNARNSTGIAREPASA